MEYLNSLMEKRNMPQLILVVLFIIFLIMGNKLPSGISSLIDTNVGKIIVIVSALALFIYTNPILGILGIFVAYELIKRSSVSTGSVGLDMYMPTEERKWSRFDATHQFPYTLEQQVVKEMTNLKFNDVPTKASWQPVLDETYDAVSL
jgi:hypothetical protein